MYIILQLAFYFYFLLLFLLEKKIREKIFLQFTSLSYFTKMLSLMFFSLPFFCSLFPLNLLDKCWASQFDYLHFLHFLCFLSLCSLALHFKFPPPCRLIWLLIFFNYCALETTFFSYALIILF